MTIGDTIASLRKECGLTQRALAEQLGVSFQTISKWERNLCYPDIVLLPRLANILRVSIDTLLGYPAGEVRRTAYFQLYQSEEYHWGITPTPFCYRILEKYPPTEHLRVLEIGCGEGRDAVFFARNGYDVTAFDIVPDGVKKAERLAVHFNVPITAFCADMLTFTPQETYDLVYASRMVQYIPPNKRKQFFETYQRCTPSGGVHAFMVLVEKPSIPPAPDTEKDIYLMRSGEIFTYYADWRFEIFEETVIDCCSSGIPHQHCVNLMLAIKP